MKRLRELSLYSGVGGGLLASVLLEHQIIGAVEIDSYCCQVLEQRQKDGIFERFPIFNIDIRDFIRQGYADLYQGRVDVLSAGFPCQPFSVAGKRKAGNDSRNMWPETIEVVRRVAPRFCFFENVRGLLSSGYFGKIVEDLAESGYSCRWRILSAAELGADHRRERLWIVAYSDCEYGIGWSQSQQSISQGRETRNQFSRSTSNVPNSPIDRLEKGRETARLRSEGLTKNTWWQTEPELDRLVDGIPNRVDRLKALGNAQVPIVAAKAWQLLTYDLFLDD